MRCLAIPTRLPYISFEQSPQSDSALFCSYFLGSVPHFCQEKVLHRSSEKATRMIIMLIKTHISRSWSLSPGPSGCDNPHPPAGFLELVLGLLSCWEEGAGPMSCLSSWLSLLVPPLSAETFCTSYHSHSTSLPHPMTFSSKFLIFTDTPGSRKESLAKSPIHLQLCSFRFLSNCPISTMPTLYQALGQR